MSIRPDATIYTDGSCLGNPGPGGWAAIISCESSVKKLSGGDASTTNNRMELLSVINGLESLRGPHIVTIFSDSQYVVNAFTKGWISNWKKNGWKRSDGEVKNLDLWKKLDKLVEKHNCTFNWVKGHAGNPYNEECDQLAQQEAKKYAEEPDAAFAEQVSLFEEQGKVKDVSALEAENQRLKTLLNETIEALSKETSGRSRPCGEYTFCDFCQNKLEERLACAIAMSMERKYS